LCCTHYGYVADRITEALSAKCCRPVRALDPNQRLVGELVTSLAGRISSTAEASDPLVAAGPDAGSVLVEVVSKVVITEESRLGVARLVELVSPATAQALRSYVLVPGLF
jgi:hypothetical protein